MKTMTTPANWQTLDSTKGPRRHVVKGKHSGRVFALCGRETLETNVTSEPDAPRCALCAARLARQAEAARQRESQ